MKKKVLTFHVVMNQSKQTFLMNFHICCYKGICKLLVAWQCKIQMHYNFSFLYLFVYAGLNVEVDRILEIACIITDGKLTRTKEVFPNLQVHFYVYNSIMLYLHIFSYQCLPNFLLAWKFYFLSVMCGCYLLSRSVSFSF